MSQEERRGGYIGSGDDDNDCVPSLHLRPNSGDSFSSRAGSERGDMSRDEGCLCVCDERRRGGVINNPLSESREHQQSESDPILAAKIEVRVAEYPTFLSEHAPSPPHNLQMIPAGEGATGGGGNCN